MSLPPLPFKVKTTVSWAGEQEGDLGFIENEVIDVYSIVDDSWWNGKLRRNKAEGIFPKDYVKIMENPPSLINSQPTTPKKQSQPVYNKSGTSPKKYQQKLYQQLPLPKRQGYQDNYDEFSFDNSYDNLVTSVDSYIQLPKKNATPTSKQDAYFIAKQREIERFKLLQQQQNYHIKKAAEYDQKQKRLSQQDFGRNSVAVLPESPRYKDNTNSNFRPHSQHFEANLNYQRQASTPNFGNVAYDKPRYSFEPQSSPPKSPSGLNMFQNNYGEHGISEASPRMKKQSPIKSPFQPNSPSQHPSYDQIDDLDEISIKKRQLEFELSQLEELQKSTMQMRIQQQDSSPKPYKHREFEYGNDIYLSEDLNTSRKNQSNDDLGKKLSRFQTDEDLYEAEFQSTENSNTPPPPPKHQTTPKIENSFGNNDEMELQVETKPYQQSKVPYDADDFRFSGNGKVILTEEEFLKLSQVQQEQLRNSIKSLQSDVLNLSELSATSAGSFLRHKYEREFMEQQDRMQELSLGKESLATELNGVRTDADNKNLMDSIFQDKKPKQSNIFKKLLKRKDEAVNPLEYKLRQEQEMEWTEFKLELNRMKTLSSDDKRLRTKRVTTQESHIIIKPLEFITDINTNEVIIGGDDDEVLNTLTFPPGYFDKADSFIQRYPSNCDLNELISDIGIKFTDKFFQLRSVLMHFIKFKIIEENGKIQQIKPKLNEFLNSGEGSIFQVNYLFKKVLDALKIPSELVFGFWKKPNEFYHNEQYIVNHCWLSVLVNHQFLIVDLLNFKLPEICNLKNSSSYNEFYFLAKPLNLVSTHLPSIIDLQHVIPPIDPNIAFHLPRLYSGYFKSSLKLQNFNNALSRLKDLEIFEMDLEVPVDVELFTLIKTSKITSNEFSLCQVYWVGNKRLAKVKALLPELETIGVLQIFAGEKGLQKHFNNIHELAIVIPLYHQGTYKSTKFVPRYPTIQSQNNDLYVKSPQTSKIIIKNSYNFVISQYPSNGISNDSKILNQDFKLVIESPSGKYFKLYNPEANKPYGDYQSHIKCQELGVYRGLVIGDSGNSWYVFAQWECVQGTVV